jgi:hypothetical protein
MFKNHGNGKVNETANLKKSEDLLRELLIEHCSSIERKEIRRISSGFINRNSRNFPGLQLQLLEDYLNCSLTLEELETRIRQIEEWKNCHDS